MFLVQATNAGGKLLELNTELIQVIDRIKQLLADDGQNLDWGDVLLELYRNRDSTSARAAVIDKALSELGVDETDLNKRLTELQGYLVELQDRMEPLLQPLGTPGELTDARVGYSAKDHELALGQVAFLVGGDTHAEISIRSYNADSLPDDWDGALDDGRALQELALGGKIAINGSGQGAWNAVNFNVSAAMSADGRIRLYHEYHADTARIAALAVSAGNWAPPWDLAGLSEQLKPPGTSGFRRVLVNGSGSIQFAGGVGIGYAASFERDVPTPDGTEALSAAAKLDGSLDVSFNHQGSFRYKIEKDPSGHLLVRVERASGSKRAVELDLDASLQIDGLDRVADHYARAFFKDPEGLLDTLQQWTRPGDRLVDVLAKKDWNQPAVKQIGALLLGEATAKELSAAGVDKLKTLLAGEINQELPFWSLDSDVLARKILERIAGRLGLGAELGQTLEKNLQDVLVKRIDQVREELQDKVQSVLDKTTDLGTELLDPLEHVGIEVKALREQANATATELLEPVIAYLKRYEQIRLRVLNALKQTARFKLGMSLGASLSRSREDEALLSFRVREVDENTRAVHRAFLLGRLGQAWSEFDAARESGAIDQVNGLFSYLSRRERKTSFALHFGEFGSIERTRVKAEEVHFQVDPSGNILAATAKLSQEAVVNAFHVERSIGVVGSYDLVAALRDPAQIPSPLAFNIAYEDKKLREKELRQFLESLEDERIGERLLAPGAADTALDRYAELLQQHGLSKAQGRVDLSIPVSLADLAPLVDAGSGIGNAAIRQRAIDVQLRLLLRRSTQYPMLQDLAGGHKDGVSINEFVLDMFGRGIDGAVAEMQRIAIRLWGAYDPDPNSNLVQLARKINQIGLNANGIIKVVEGIRAIAAVQQKLVELPASPLEKDIAPLRKPIDQATKQINDGLANWLKARGVISGLFTEALPEQTLAFLALLAELSPEPQHLMPVVKIDNVENGLVVVA